MQAILTYIYIYIYIYTVPENETFTLLLVPEAKYLPCVEQNRATGMLLSASLFGLKPCSRRQVVVIRVLITRKGWVGSIIV